MLRYFALAAVVSACAASGNPARGTAAASPAVPAADVAAERMTTSISHDETKDHESYRWELTFDGREFTFIYTYKWYGHRIDALGEWKFREDDLPTLAATLAEFGEACAKARAEKVKFLSKRFRKAGGSWWEILWSSDKGSFTSSLTYWNMEEKSAMMLRIFLLSAPELVSEWKRRDATEVEAPQKEK